MRTSDQSLRPTSAPASVRRRGLVVLGDAVLQGEGQRLEALFRYDHFKPNASSTIDAMRQADDRRRRLLVPASGQRVDGADARLRRQTFGLRRAPLDSKRCALHGLINF